eukprot:2952840-Alexandrium_andersonii.AAC.1
MRSIQTADHPQLRPPAAEWAPDGGVSGCCCASPAHKHLDKLPGTPTAARVAVIPASPRLAPLR